MKVYFLGAGASKSFYPSLPTASELTLDSLLDSSTYDDAPSDAMGVLRSFAGSRKLSAAQRTQPIEEILDVFDGNRREYLSLQFSLLKRLWAPDKPDTSLLKNWLAGVRQSKEVLITTNYDTVLERGFYKTYSGPKVNGKKLMEGPFNYGVDRKLLMSNYENLACDSTSGSTPLLKLHGSISWSYCQSCRRAALHPAYKRKGTDAFAGEKCDCGGGLSPILVGPAKKQYDHPLISNIVETAREVLQKANEIVFAGFSMSQGDEQIRGLLAGAHVVAHTKSVVIVDKKACELRPEYQKIYPDLNIEVHEMDCAKYLGQNGRLTSPMTKLRIKEIMGSLKPKPGEPSMFEELFAERERERKREK
jgi:NAD-dependent SIR2 family protein deacetylase